jgi:hypothetical protein
MTAKSSNRRPTPLQEAFPPACAAAFDALLAGYGFARGAAECAPYHCRQQYVAAGGRYIEVAANVEPRDYPYHCSLSLGEGRTDWPERDWNAIGLWRLIRERAPGRAGG